MTIHTGRVTGIPHFENWTTPKTAVRWAFDQNQLKPVHRCVLIALADYADTYKEIIIHRRKLAEWAGIHIDTVGTALKALEEHGLIAIFRRYHTDGMQTANKYVLNIR